MIDPKKSLCFEDVDVGVEIPRLKKGPMTTAHLMRWSATMENWHKIHYDAPFAINHDKLPGVLVNGSFKQQYLVQLLKDWAGLSGWIWKLSYQFRAMNLVGETLTVWGNVTGKRAAPDFGLVDLDIGIVNDLNKESTPGKATVALPFRAGKPLPYPFVAPKLSP
jgi:acyl dehydratase